MEERIKTDPPAYPWEPGINEKYTMYRIVVQICQDQVQNIFSQHEFLNTLDQDSASSLPSFGNEQTAYALLLEGLRREAFLEILIKLSDNPSFLADLKSLDEESREAEIQELVDFMTDFIQQTTTSLIPQVFRDVLAMMENQLESV